MRRKRSAIKGWASGVALVWGFVAMFGAPGHAAVSAGRGGEPLRIILRVHDYAGVPPGILADSLVETARVLHLAGIEMSVLVKDYTAAPREPFGTYWPRIAKKLHRAGSQTDLVDCSHPVSAQDGGPRCQRTDPAVLVVSIVSHDMIPEYGLPSGFFGLAPTQSDDTRPLTYALIFYPRIDEFCEDRRVPRPLLLGLAVAHELGHLLLGMNSHASGGLMRGRWVASDLCPTCRAKWVFTSEQSEMLRGEVRARMAPRDTTPSALLTSRR
jgi:hypothetical protein